MLISVIRIPISTDLGCWLGFDSTPRYAWLFAVYMVGNGQCTMDNGQCHRGYFICFVGATTGAAHSYSLSMNCLELLVDIAYQSSND